MEFSGKYLIFARRRRVWSALNDVKVLKKAIPGCDNIEWQSSSTLDLSIRVNLGVIKPKFGGELELSNIIEAKSYTLCGHAKGNLLGVARASADVKLNKYRLQEKDFARDFLFPEIEIDPDALLNPSAAGTVLEFEASGGASKKIMALGNKLIGNSAQRVINGFMGRFSSAMQAPIAQLPKNLTGEKSDI
ncbi:hypothetical protein MNBD_ALPHA11-2127 [hydrothermal vent metagenome]|uniref:Carbon monoxide dehydrogenase n=1 Tax=hydrothermal vent metagenome TaxID=652676 RepID=A0A3B0T9Z7_9ZZZZ